jgi:hypothetical protein
MLILWLEAEIVEIVRSEQEQSRTIFAMTL